MQQPNDQTNPFVLEAAEAIRSELVKRGMTQSELARALGVSRPRISVLMSGARPLTLTMIFRISEKIGVKPKIFLE